jgi:DNA polymerase-3 subunit gamma/tau
VPAGGAAVGNELHQVRTLWPDVLETLRARTKAGWTLINHNAQVVGAAPGVVTLGFSTEGRMRQFLTAGREPSLVAALSQVLGGQWRVETLVDPSAGGGQTTARSAPAGRNPAAAGQPQGRPDSVPVTPASADMSDEASVDDVDADPGVSTHELLSRELGATVIEKIAHDR